MYLAASATTIPLLAFLFVGAVIVVVAVIRQKKHRKAAQQFARDRSWTYHENGKQLPEIFNLPDFVSFQNIAYCLEMGAHGRMSSLDVLIGDYASAAGTSKDRKSLPRTYCLIGLPGNEGEQTLPDFVLATEGFSHKLADLFGYTDIDFDTHPKFSKRYRLISKEEQPIRELFSDATLHYFEEHVDPGRTIEANGRWLLIYRRSQHKPVTQWNQLLDENLQVLQALID